MAQQTKDYLKSRFQNGDQPNEQDFIDVFDSLALQTEVDLNTAKRSYPVADETKLDGIEVGATADQSAVEIIALIDAQQGNTDWRTQAAGVTDHGALTGLLDDDHTQYHNDARALTWLGTRSADDLPEGSTNLYITSAERTKLANLDSDYWALSGTTTIGDVTIDLDGANSNLLKYSSSWAGPGYVIIRKDIIESGSGSGIYDELSIASGGIYWDVDVYKGLNHTRLYMDDTSMWIGKSTSHRLFFDSSGNILLTDTANGKGFYYSADYASGATDLWIPNKKYVDDSVPTGAEVVSLINTELGGTGWQTGGSGTPGGSDGQLQYNNGGSFGGTAAIKYDDVNGRIGINMTSPVARIHVSTDGVVPISGTYSGPAAQGIFVSGNTYVGFEATMASSTNTFDRPTFAGNRARGSVAVPTAVALDDEVFAFLGRAYDGTAMQSTAAITGYVDGTVSSGNVPQRISFVTSPSGTAGRLERFVIKSDGKIWICATPDNADSADVILLRDGTNGEITKLGIGTNLSVSGGNLVAAGGSSDHGGLTGLLDDDHTQYHNDARALTWLGTRSADDLPQGATNLYLTSAERTKLTGIESSADVTDATNVDAAGAVMESDFNAQTILAATTDNTPSALTVGEDTLVGRLTGGNIAALSKTQVLTYLGVDPNRHVTLTSSASISLDLNSNTKVFAQLETALTATTITLSNLVASKSVEIDITIEKNTASDLVVTLAGTSMKFVGYNNADLLTSPSITLSGASGDIFTISIIATTLTDGSSNRLLKVAVASNAN